MPKSQTMDKTKQLVQRLTDEVKLASAREKFLELIEFIAISRLTHLSREEIRAMLNLEDYKKSRFYKEIQEETRKEAIETLSEQGFKAEEIAHGLKFDLAIVKKILKKKTKK